MVAIVSAPMPGPWIRHAETPSRCGTGPLHPRGPEAHGAVCAGRRSPTLGPIVSAPPGPTGNHGDHGPPPKPPSRPRPALIVVLTAIGLLAGACGTAVTSPKPGSGPASTVASGRAAGGYRVTGSLAGGHTTASGIAAAREATASFRAEIGNDAAAFVATIGRLQADLLAGNLTAARADEIGAQSAYDGFRLLESGNTVIASTLDERLTDLGPGQTLAGLHAVERDLWAPTPAPGQAGALSAALDDTSGLAAQAPVAQYLLSRNALDPEAIGTTAVDELGWVNDVALPGDEELYSHLDTVDIAGTVGAAASAFSAIQPLARMVSPPLTAAVASLFATLEADVAALGPPGQRVDDTIPVATQRALAQQVDATAAGLARLSALLTPYGTSGATS